MRKFIIALVGLVLLAPLNANAMGSGDMFSDAQTGFTYSIYKPANTLGLKLSDFQLIPCTPGNEEWLYAKYGSGKKYVEIMETMAGVKCSDPGLSKVMKPVMINGVGANVYVYCDPAYSKLYRLCNINDFGKYGGYLMFTTKSTKLLKGTEIQVQGIGGITYEQALAVAKSLKVVGK